MRFRTELNIAKQNFRITHSDNILLLGSCFAENIADKLLRYKYNVLVNPFGIVYNPASVSKIIERIVEGNHPDKGEFMKRDELWHHFEFHGDMSGQYIEEVVEKINRWMSFSKEFLTGSDYVFLTFGTSIIYKRKDTNEIVANNHKFPSNYFKKSRLNLDSIVTYISNTISNIHKLNPNVKVILTVSPVRHIKEGIVENQLSKATLLLAIDKIVDNRSVFYFPSYELVLDDLRDYRFYSKDLVHPSEEAIDYIWEKFSDVYFDERTKQKNYEIEKILKSLEHRPFNKKTESYKLFSKNLKSKIQLFMKNNPDVDFGEELKGIS